MMWQESKEETRLVGPSFGRQNTVANDRDNIDGSPCLCSQSLGCRILSKRGTSSFYHIKIVWGLIRINKLFDSLLIMIDSY